MLLGELIAAAQDDIAEKRGDAEAMLISSSEWVRFANEGERQACRRAHLLVDSTTADFCRATVTAGNPVIPISNKILRVRRVVRVSDGQTLEKTRVDLLDSQFQGWETETGEIDCYTEDYQSNTIRLYRVPSVNDELRMTVVRIPAADMANVLTDAPEINPSYHEGIVKWMLWRAYSKRDVDIEADWPRARENLAAFTQEFGEAISAKDDNWIRTKQGIDPFEGSY